MTKQSSPKKRAKQSAKRQPSSPNRSTAKAAKRAPAPRANATLTDDLAAIRRRRFTV